MPTTAHNEIAFGRNFPRRARLLCARIESLPFWPRQALAAMLYAAYLGFEFLPLAENKTEIPYHFWQFLPLAPRLERPLESLFFLHSQPPLLNVLYWLIHLPHGTATLAPENLATALMLACGLLAVCCWLECARWFTGSVRLGLLLIVLLLANPAFSTYTRLFFYTHPLLALYALLVWCLIRWAQRPTPARACAAGLLFTVIVYTRALWHPAAAIGLGALMGLHDYRRRGNAWGALKTGLVFCGLFFALALPWMLKTRVLFNTWGFSSWTGLNLVQDSRTNPIWQFRERNGEYNPRWVAQYYSARQLRRFEGRPAVSLLHYTVGDRPPLLNMNHFALPALNRSAMRMNIAAIRADPAQYLRRCLLHQVYFHLPSYARCYTYQQRTGECLLNPDTAYSRRHQRFVHGEFLKQWLRLEYGGVLYAPNVFQLLLWSAMLLALFEARQIGSPRGFITAVMLYLYLWVWLMATLVEGVESQRMRWPLEPVYLCLVFNLLLRIGRALVQLARPAAACPDSGRIDAPLNACR